MRQNTIEDQLDFERDGVCLVPGVVFGHALDKLRIQITSMAGTRGGARMDVVPADARDLLVGSGSLSLLAARLAGAAARPVRVLVFDKSAEKNWGLSWHQDRAIAVEEKKDVPGFRNWTVKQGIPHAEPPAHILEKIVTLRLHLDDCGPDNGPLEVARGSYRSGVMSKAEIRENLAAMDCRACLASAGDVLAMRGLTIHRSGPAKVPSHRRVLHVDYCAASLPAGLSWRAI